MAVNDPVLSLNTTFCQQVTYGGGGRPRANSLISLGVMNAAFSPILEAFAAHLRSRDIQCELRANPPTVACACALGDTDIAVSVVADGQATYADLAVVVSVPDARQAETVCYLAFVNRTVRGPQWRLDTITGQAILRMMPLEQRFHNDPASATVEELINDVELGLSIISGNLPALRGVATGQLDADTAQRHVQADIFRALGIPESFEGA